MSLLLLLLSLSLLLLGVVSCCVQQKRWKECGPREFGKDRVSSFGKVVETTKQDKNRVVLPNNVNATLLVAAK